LVAMLRSPLPPLETILDSDDRRILAQATRLGDVGWAGQYLAEASVTERTSETVRNACLGSLLSLLPTLGHCLRLLADAFLAAASVPNSAGNSVARLVRLMRALRTTIARVESEAGDGIGVALQTMVDAAVHDPGAGSKNEGQLAEETARLLHEIIKG